MAAETARQFESLEVQARKIMAVYVQAGHELVRRDLAARKKDGGTPLFVALAEDEPKPRPAARKAQ